MTKRLLLTGIFFCLAFIGFAQKKNFTYKFYGRVRGDLFYNSRANGEIVDGLFHLYPKDHNYDADGNDLNAQSNSSFYVIYSRIGIDMTGPNIGKIKTSAKIESDFRGSGSSFALLRIRHAYINLAWQKSNLLVGQTWHPFFGEIFPQVLNLNTGAPYNAFSRNPQLRYRFNHNNWQLTGAAVWQLQYKSNGPDGKSTSYQKNSCLPEFYAGIDYKKDEFQGGVGAAVLTLKPRTQNTVDGNVYKIDESIVSKSFEAHVRYKTPEWLIAAKSTLGENMTHTSMLGGYGVTKIDGRTGEQEYTPFRHSMTWLNVVHGTKWKQGLFVGYLKNLGTREDIIKKYGTGLEVGQEITVDLQLSYNLPHWKFGVEYSPSTAWFGTADKRGKINDTHSVTNHRMVFAMLYFF